MTPERTTDRGKEVAPGGMFGFDVRGTGEPLKVLEQSHESGSGH